MRTQRTLHWLGAIIATSMMTAFAGIAQAQTHDTSVRSVMAPAWWACVEAAQEVEGLSNMPDHLLTAIALTESGRRTPNRAIAPWPWTINVAGRGYRYATKAQAMQAARDLLEAGTRSFDVGCMQINMRYHPRAFTSIEEAFDPLANVMYAADFISRLRSNNGGWNRAVELYHSYNEEFNQIYGERVQGFWSMARRRAASGDILMLARPTEVRENTTVHAALPEGFGPREIATDEDDDLSASRNGLRLARAIDQTRAQSEASFMQIAPMAVALMQSDTIPFVLNSSFAPTLSSTRAPAIRRRMQQNPTSDEAGEESSL